MIALATGGAITPMNAVAAPAAPWNLAPTVIVTFITSPPGRNWQSPNMSVNSAVVIQCHHHVPHPGP